MEYPIDLRFIKKDRVLKANITKYDPKRIFGAEGFAIEIIDGNLNANIIGIEIGRWLMKSEVKNLFGETKTLTELEKVVLAARAYLSEEFSNNSDTKMLTLENYETLINRQKNLKEVRNSISAILYKFVNYSDEKSLEGLSIYSSLNYEISFIRKALEIMVEIGDVEVTDANIGYWSFMYKLSGSAFKTVESNIDNIEPRSIPFNNRQESLTFEYDFFISHASEDKDLFVRELAIKLKDQQFNIWYDEFSLSWGDSLRQSIERGLKESKHGIVVLSDNFFAKDWPQRELDGLFELESQKKKILPIWFKIDRDGIANYSPILAGRLALKAEEGYEKIINEAKKLLGRN